ncbi:MAG: hypothetical protein HWN79_19315 [Candidatus Lokiarchaeota archaeon]|nr:hypothetical protein [Candidatus Lokiarchaeota archaeon]
MVFKEEKISNSRKALFVIFFIVCAVSSILTTSAIHFKILTEIQPGYLYNVYLLNFLWMDILIGLGIGFALFITIGMVLNYYFTLKEGPNSTQ